jgi:hypothetical protein
MLDTRCSTDEGRLVFLGARILVEERWDWDKFVVENAGGWGRIL